MLTDIDYVREFIIDQTGGDYRVELYDRWCNNSVYFEYDHENANAFILTSAQDLEPEVLLKMIFDSFYTAALTYSSSLGIFLNDEASPDAINTWLESMSLIGTQEDYTELLCILQSDQTPTDKVQFVFEHLGPGADDKYKGLVKNVHKSTIDGFIELITEISDKSSNTVGDKTEIIKEKMKVYNHFKKKIEGTLFSDRFATQPNTYDLDIDCYITHMQPLSDYYTDPSNWEDYILDVWGCLILSNAQAEQYPELLRASVYTMYTDDTSRNGVLQMMQTKLPMLQS